VRILPLLSEQLPGRRLGRQQAEALSLQWLELNQLIIDPIDANNDFN
jgi:hypothetical protein